MPILRRRLRPRLTGRARRQLFRTGARDARSTVVQARVLTVPNLVTVLRLLALPYFGYLVLARHAFGSALVVLLALAVSDILDGYLARRLGQVSRLGEVLDPVTDRATLVTVSVCLLIAGVVPVLLAVLVVARDVLIAILVGVVFRGWLPVPVTRAAKLGTAGLLFGIPGFLAARLSFPGAELIRVAAIALSVAGVVCYYLALAQYAGAGLRRWRRPAASVGGGAGRPGAGG
jgi:cardiolipin synthase